MILLANSAFTQVSLINTYKANNHLVIAVSVSPNGELVASSGYDKSIIIRDKTGEIVKRIKGQKTVMYSMAFSSDSKYLISGGDNRYVYVWDVETGLLTYKLEGHTKDINTVDISINNIIASGSDDKTIIYWDLNTGQQIQKVEAHEGKVNSIEFSSNGEFLVSGGEDELVKIWDGKTGALQRSISDREKKAGAIKYVAFSPDGQSVASSDNNKRIVLWSISGLKSNTINMSDGYAVHIDFSPDGRFIAAGTSNKRFVIYNTQTEAVVYVSEKQKDVVYSLAFGSKGKYLVSCDYSNNVYVWDIKSLGIPAVLASMDRNSTQKETTIVESKKTQPIVFLKSDVDIDIPNVCSKPNENRYALIIGNEDYSSHQTNLEAEVNVDFAVNDAKAFKLYATKVLCIPEDNIMLLTDATAIEMHRSIEKINLLSEVTGSNTELFFYYAGHGFPDEKTKEPYIMPVDVSGNDLRFAINIKDLYAKLTEHPHKRVTVFLDACFTGGARNQGLLAARGVKIVPKNQSLFGNLVVFSASSGQESSLPYKEKKHGIFTYFLLKELKESKGNISYKELSDYLKIEVARKSILINSKPQNPQTNISPSISVDWNDWNLKD